MPVGWDKQAMPVMVFLHGSGNTGRQMSYWFQPLADKYKCELLPVISPTHRTGDE